MSNFNNPFKEAIDVEITTTIKAKCPDCNEERITIFTGSFHATDTVDMQCKNCNEFFTVKSY